MPGDLADEVEEYLRLHPIAVQVAERLDQRVTAALHEALEAAGGDQEAEQTIARAAAGELRKLADRLDAL
jgi:hypothetical protein